MNHEEPPSGQPAQVGRVLIVDDDVRVRRALRDLIESSPELTVVGAAASVRAALDMELDAHPDVVLLDLLLPRASDGVHVLRELRNRNRTVIAMSALGSLRQEALDGGAFAFVEKEGRDVDDLHDLLCAAVAVDPTTATARTRLEAKAGRPVASDVREPPRHQLDPARRRTNTSREEGET